MSERNLLVRIRQPKEKKQTVCNLGYAPRLVLRSFGWLGWVAGKRLKKQAMKFETNAGELNSIMPGRRKEHMGHSTQNLEASKAPRRR